MGANERSTVLRAHTHQCKPGDVSSLHLCELKSGPHLSNCRPAEVTVKFTTTLLNSHSGGEYIPCGACQRPSRRPDSRRGQSLTNKGLIIAPSEGILHEFHCTACIFGYFDWRCRLQDIDQWCLFSRLTNGKTRLFQSPGSIGAIRG